MASGHVNRAKRPNTWQHRPKPAYVKKALANSEPSTHGTSRQAARRFRVRAAFLADLERSDAGRFAAALPPILPPLRDGA